LVLVGHVTFEVEKRLMSLSRRVCAIRVCLELSRTTLANSSCPQVLSQTKCAIRVSLEYCHEARVQLVCVSDIVTNHRYAYRCHGECVPFVRVSNIVTKHTYN